MTKKAEIVIAGGFEEGEALVIVDILRRCGIDCRSAGLTDKEVTGAHDITMMCDKTLDETTKEADMIILPGGYGGTEAMGGSEYLREVLLSMNASGKFVCAICAAPEVLFKAGLLKDKKFTAYPGYETKITDGTYLTDLVVKDGNIITGRGPSVAYAFGYYLAEVLGADVQPVKDKMLYDHAFDPGAVTITEVQ